MTSMQKQKINKEELEVMRAMQIVAKYRATHVDSGFARLALLLQLFMDTATAEVAQEKRARCRK